MIHWKLAKQNKTDGSISFITDSTSRGLGAQPQEPEDCLSLTWFLKLGSKLLDEQKVGIWFKRRTVGGISEKQELVSLVVAI